MEQKKNNFQVDFIGIGTIKSGTSWIYQCLKEHPQICASIEKEIYFFCRQSKYEKGLNYYQSYFSHCPNKMIKGEFTTNYLSNKKSSFLIKKHFPKVKLIACLRNPIQRVYSNYYYDKVRGKRSGSFEKYLKETPEYIQNGLYYTHLQEYLKLFPRENILILIYEDISKNPLQFIQGIYKFLEVNSNFNPPSLNQRVNPTSKDRLFVSWFSSVNFQKTLTFLKKHFWGRQLIKLLKLTKISTLLLFLKVKNVKDVLDKSNKIFLKPPMKPETRSYLQKIYKDEINNLEKLIDRDLSFWK